MQINIAVPFAVRGFVNAAFLGNKAAILRSEVSALNIAFEELAIGPYVFYEAGMTLRNQVHARGLTAATTWSAGVGLRDEMLNRVSVDRYVGSKLG